ncbi:putative oxidoreductase [Flammeovirgaceae bacterium 311]|nr:putative oxidoreductase [Flammeovirgaceae bacterium 311]
MSCFVNRIQRKQQARKAREKQQELQKPAGTASSEIYACTNCGNALFAAEAKFESGTGFPSFWMHIGDHVSKKFLDTYGRERTQLLCNSCGQHLGHLFPNKKTPTRLRYCINQEAVALTGNA